MSELLPDEGATAPNRQALLDNLYQTLDLFEFRQPHDVLHGCSPDYLDPLVDADGAQHWVKSGTPHRVRHDADGREIPVGLGLDELVQPPSHRLTSNTAWKISFEGSEEIETRFLAGKLDKSIRAQVRCTNPAGQNGIVYLGAHEYPEGMFFFPRPTEHTAQGPGEKLSVNPLDALFFPDPPFDRELVQATLHDPSVTAEQLASFRAPEPALALLLHGLLNYIQQYPLARSIWAALKEKPPEPENP